MTMQDNVDAEGVARYPVGSWPIMDPATGDVLVDEVGRMAAGKSYRIDRPRNADTITRPS